MNTQAFIDQLDQIATPMPSRASMGSGLLNLKAAAQALGLTPLTPTLITVAGTNGKGSSVTFLEQVLYQAGYQVGSYTSPHIVEFNERIRINTQPVDKDTLHEALKQIEPITHEFPLSFFELTTLLAFQCYARQPLDVIVAEVGLGGRLDAVNAFDADIALISTIDFDHMHILGSTREEIGREKAGIMRSGCPVVCADPHPPHCVAEVACEKGAKLYQLGQDFFVTEGLQDALIGPTNAAGCCQVLELIAEKHPVDRDLLERALRTVNPRARLQHFQRGCEWIIDVAHNPASMRRLANHCQRLPTAARTVALVGMCKDKDHHESLVALNEIVDEWHVAPFTHPRSSTAQKLSQTIKAFSEKPCYTHDSIAQAAGIIQQQQRATDRIVVCGSFFTIADLLRSDQWTAAINND